MVQLPDEGCTGCRACFTICPIHAITMEAENDGFVYPSIDRALCIECGKCMKTCPAREAQSMMRQPERCVAAQISNGDTLKRSTSGGVFSALAQKIVQCGGAVYGCTFDDHYNARITRANTEIQLEQIRGSKYVWSDTGESYEHVKNDLKKGRKVLFTGLPCQVAGLRKYLCAPDNNLFAVDVLCGGAPSPYAFQRYLETITDEKGMRSLRFQFRDKEPYGSGVHCTYYVHGKKIHEDYLHNSFYFAFSSKSRLTWRKCCYSCNYKSMNRVSDITIGDYWGVEKHHSHFNPKEGVSVILINTEQGEQLFGQIKDRLVYEESKAFYVTEKNSLVAEIQAGHVQIPRNRDQFFQLLQKEGWEAVDKRYLYDRKRLIRKSAVKEFIKNLECSFFGQKS